MQQPIRVRLRRGLVAALLLAGSLAAQDKNQTTAPAAAKPTIGVVDFVKVFETYPKYIQEHKRLEESKKGAQARLDEEKNRVNEIKAQREALNPGTRERAEADLQLDLAVKRYQGIAQILGADLDQQDEKLRVECYEDIERAITKLGKERGLLLVLRLHRNLGAGSMQEKGQAYERRIVWYAADEVDLTAEVIKLMAVGGGEAGGNGKESAPAKASAVPPAGK